MPFKFSPGHCDADCNCGEGGPECPVDFVVSLCGSPIGGATVRIWEDDAKAVLLGSGVTNSSGEVTVSIPAGPPGLTFWYYEASHPSDRVGVASGEDACSVSVDDLGEVSVFPPFPIAVDLPPAEHYYCNQWCQFPLFETLHYSDDVLGPVTLFNSGSGAWNGTLVRSFGSGDPCPSTAVEVEVAANTLAGGVGVTFPRASATDCASCPLPVGSGGTLKFCSVTSSTVLGCPDDGGAFSLAFTYSPGVLNPESPAPVSGTLTE